MFIIIQKQLIEMSLRSLSSYLFLTALLISCTKPMQKKTDVTKNKEITANEDVIFELDFENNKRGAYDSIHLNNDVGVVNWSSIDGRAQMEEDSLHGKVLKVFYPKGSVGPKQGGIQFDKTLPKAEAYYLDYYLKFKEGFDFRLGGKLHGLTSGGEKFTGGIHPDNGEGWSARYMWRKGGELVLYFYHMDMKGKWGDDLNMNTTLLHGKWYRITQYIKLNSGDQFNGVMEVWLDGKRILFDEQVRYRLAPLGEIDSFYFSTFHGGNTADWAPKNDSYIYFDKFKVSVNKPENLN